MFLIEGTLGIVGGVVLCDRKPFYVLKEILVSLASVH